MSASKTYDAIVIGSGPNGLAAAITLARAGKSVLLREGAPTIGGSARSLPLTLPGFVHDVCSTVHALARVSPFLQSLPLAEQGLELLDPPLPFAHPFDDGSAAVLERSVEATADLLGDDAAAYRALLGPLVRGWEQLSPDLLGPPRLPRHPILMMRFGLRGLPSARSLVERNFVTAHARALFAGAAAHSILPLDWSATSAFGLVLTASAHAAGWPIARGGSQNLVAALASIFRSFGGEIVTGAPVVSLDDLPRSRMVLCDVTPRQLLKIAGDRLPSHYRHRLGRYRYGPGTFKLDWALSGPIPWKAPACARAATVHVCGTFEEIAVAEAAPWRGEHTDRPFVLLVQPSLFDPSRAPAGQHTAWAYCHVPHGSTVDRTEAIENQIERFAPGFRSLILARHGMNSADFERYNPNLVGGDINGGSQDITQLFTRPVVRLNPYKTPVKGLYICSASTPPGGGVHGMCGHFAARAALKELG
jgi:phytoene dehydrogenase-like protein